MNILDIIAKKRDGKELKKEEIEYFIKEYTKEKITDYQAAALIMAIYINGLSDEELFNLTFSMANSGEILDLSTLGGNIVDKHSTGGVGDKVSIVLLPIIASLGIPVAKMSGRGLGFTGGTVDKLESIPGYNTKLQFEEFIKNVRKIGISIIGQTTDLAPADKKIYALRDTISCVDNIALIASSIMSKKIASGANKIVLEVTYGKGAFMQSKKDAEILASEMVKLGRSASRDVECVFTPMDEPLGYAIGNILEVIESVEFLKGNMCKDLENEVLEIGSRMIKLANKGDNIKDNKKMMLENIYNGKALAKFKELVQMQGGDVSFIENTDKFPKAKFIKQVHSKKQGRILELNAREIGELACFLGAGRIKKEDNIDKTVGIIINKKVGDIVNQNDLLATIYANDDKKLEYAINKLTEIFVI